MNTQREQTRKQTAQQKRKTRTIRSWLWASGVGVALLVTALFILNNLEGPSESWGLPAVPREARPATLSPVLFTGKVGEAYRIAREAPELLEHMPCYCGCYVGNQHRNNLDCYVDRHAVG